MATEANHTVINWALRLLPVFVLAIPVIGTWYVMGERMKVQAQEIEDHSESIDEIEDAIAEIDRLLLQRQGAVDLRTQRIELEQQQQGKSLEEILLLLRQLQNSGGN